MKNDTTQTRSHGVGPMTWSWIVQAVAISSRLGPSSPCGPNRADHYATDVPECVNMSDYRCGLNDATPPDDAHVYARSSRSDSRLTPGSHAPILVLLSTRLSSTGNRLADLAPCWPRSFLARKPRCALARWRVSGSHARSNRLRTRRHVVPRTGSLPSCVSREPDFGPSDTSTRVQRERVRRRPLAPYQIASHVSSDGASWDQVVPPWQIALSRVRLDINDTAGLAACQ